jgi:hypothetical protein
MDVRTDEKIVFGIDYGIDCNLLGEPVLIATVAHQHALEVRQSSQTASISAAYFSATTTARQPVWASMSTWLSRALRG